MKPTSMANCRYNIPCVSTTYMLSVFDALTHCSLTRVVCLMSGAGSEVPASQLAGRLR